MQSITISLDGREVSGYAGTTILHLASESGIYIPTLCNDPHLAPVGACRICVVEDERNGNLLASCVTPISSGMKINTNSPLVRENRKNIIELMLASHPDICMVCDKGNRCQLRQIATDMGIGLSNLYKIPQPNLINEINNFIERDLTKCILCAKCIRACQELVIEGAIDYFQRGFITKPATFGDLPLESSECTFCGTCVAICPTGALSEKEKIYRGATSTVSNVICPYCACGCRLSIETKGNQVLRASPSNEESVNKGTACILGSYGCDFVNSRDRLTRPLIKVNNEFQEATWDDALKLISDKLLHIKREYGPNSIAVLGSSRCSNEDNYVLQRFARCTLQTNNIDNSNHINSCSSFKELGSCIGIPGTTKSINDLEKADVILVIGSDISNLAPIVSYAIKRAVKYHSARLILIHPLKTKMTEFAHLWLRPRIGTEIILINGVANIIVENNLFDTEFVTRRTDNYKQFLKVINKYSPDKVEAMTTVPAQYIYEVARILSGASSPIIVFDTDTIQQISSPQLCKSLSNLIILTGNIREEGGGIIVLQKENNAQGVSDMGVLPDYLPGYAHISDVKSRKKFEEKWGTALTITPGLTIVEVLEKAVDKEIKALYVMGDNPLSNLFYINIVKEALNSIDFIVVQDMFLTETALLADVVLPSASFLEKDGTYTNLEGCIQKSPKILTKPGESRPDWKIIADLSNEMNFPLPFNSTEAIMQEIDEMVPIYFSYSDLNSLHVKSISTLSTRFEFAGNLLKGFARFSPVDYFPEVDGANEYPFILQIRYDHRYFGTGTRISNARRFAKIKPDNPFIEICASDARKLSVEDGEIVKISSPTHSVKVQAYIKETVTEGIISSVNTIPNNPLQQFYIFPIDTETKTPLIKNVRVNITKVEDYATKN